MGREKFLPKSRETAEAWNLLCYIERERRKNDKASNLSRKDVFRLNIGASKGVYSSLLNTLPKRAAMGCFIDGGYDFQRTDIVLPHPVYGWMGWICVLNPSEEKFEKYKDFLDDAYK